MTLCTLFAAAQIGGVFRNTLSRRKRRDDGSWEVSDVLLTDADIAEIDARLAYAVDMVQKGTE